MSNRIAARYTVAKTRVQDRVETPSDPRHREDGMETIEIALWAGAIVVIAIALTLVIKNFVTKSTAGL